MDKEAYIDHELRIRMLEYLNDRMASRLIALITIAVTSIALPLLMKYFGI